MTPNEEIEFNKIRVGNCKEGTCCKLEDLQICSVKDPEHSFVREPYKSLYKKEGYEDLQQIPKNLIISINKKLSEIRQERLFDWRKKQIEKLGRCPHH